MFFENFIYGYKKSRYSLLFYVQDKQFGGLKYDGLFQCVLGGRSDLRAGTDTFGKDKAPAGPRYGASGVYGRRDQLLWAV